MDFDPTYNYGNSDLTNEDNLIRWKFGELITNLITLSSSAERQIEIVGFGCVCDEMAIDFDTYFMSAYPLYLDNNLLTKDQVGKLQELESFFDIRSKGNSPGFWDDTNLATSSEWQTVRQKARSILELIGMQDLTIEFDRNEKYEVTENGKRLIIQTTKTRLARSRQV